MTERKLLLCELFKKFLNFPVNYQKNPKKKFEISVQIYKKLNNLNL
jgi:hypothetical protein